jgi:hypothetical protein
MYPALFLLFLAAAAILIAIYLRRTRRKPDAVRLQADPLPDEPPLAESATQALPAPAVEPSARLPEHEPAVENSSLNEAPFETVTAAQTIAADSAPDNRDDPPPPPEPPVIPQPAAHKIETAEACVTTTSLVVDASVSDVATTDATAIQDQTEYTPGIEEAINETADKGLEIEALAVDATDNSAAERVSGTVHQDRRGARRASARPAQSSTRRQASNENSSYVADASLRLTLTNFPKRAALSLVLARPETFPETVNVTFAGMHLARAYGPRYDDIDVEWTPELLDGEIRIRAETGHQWLRSIRRVHIFTARPDESELISVNAARAGIDHALVCRSPDLETVNAIAKSAGSPPLTALSGFEGVPSGWVIAGGYKPQRQAIIADPAFSTLDPDTTLSITLSGGLEIRSKVFAEGHAPRIETDPIPDGTSITIDGTPAQLIDDAWVAQGWDSVGTHLVDIVPGPSLTYSLAADPAKGTGWEYWNAHDARSAESAPWARVQICGAQLRGPDGESVLVRETQPKIIALGIDGGAAPLQPRPETSISIALLKKHAAFLLVSSGPRRKHNKIVWLGLPNGPRVISERSRADLTWAHAVHLAASCRAALDFTDTTAKETWRKAVRRARALRKQRS